MPFLKISKQKIWNINIFGHTFKWTATDSIQQILITIMILIHEETSHCKDRNRKRVYSSIRVVIRKKKN